MRPFDEQKIWSQRWRLRIVCGCWVAFHQFQTILCSCKSRDIRRFVDCRWFHLHLFARRTNRTVFHRSRQFFWFIQEDTPRYPLRHHCWNQRGHWVASFIQFASPVHSSMGIYSEYIAVYVQSPDDRLMCISWGGSHLDVLTHIQNYMASIEGRHPQSWIEMISNSSRWGQQQAHHRKRDVLARTFGSIRDHIDERGDYFFNGFLNF